jgi:hypothetical protein
MGRYIRAYGARHKCVDCLYGRIELRRGIRIRSTTHTMGCGSLPDETGCSHGDAGPCQLLRATILPGAPDTAEPFHGPYRREAGAGTGSGSPCVRGRCGLCDIRMGCVHLLFLFTLLNTQYEAGWVIYPDFATGFAAIFINFLRIWYHIRIRITAAGFASNQDIISGPDN